MEWFKIYIFLAVFLHIPTHSNCSIWEQMLFKKNIIFFGNIISYLYLWMLLIRVRMHRTFAFCLTEINMTILKFIYTFYGAFLTLKYTFILIFMDLSIHVLFSMRLYLFIFVQPLFGHNRTSVRWLNWVYSKSLAVFSRSAEPQT